MTHILQYEDEITTAADEHRCRSGRAYGGAETNSDYQRTCWRRCRYAGISGSACRPKYRMLKRSPCQNMRASAKRQHVTVAAENCRAAAGYETTRNRSERSVKPHHARRKRAEAANCLLIRWYKKDPDFYAFIRQNSLQRSGRDDHEARTPAAHGPTSATR